MMARAEAQRAAAEAKRKADAERAEAEARRAAEAKRVADAERAEAEARRAADARANAEARRAAAEAKRIAAERAAKAKAQAKRHAETERQRVRAAGARSGNSPATESRPGLLGMLRPASTKNNVIATPAAAPLRAEPIRSIDPVPTSAGPIVDITIEPLSELVVALPAGETVEDTHVIEAPPETVADETSPAAIDDAAGGRFDRLVAESVTRAENEPEPEPESKGIKGLVRHDKAARHVETRPEPLFSAATEPIAEPEPPTPASAEDGRWERLVAASVERAAAAPAEPAPKKANRRLRRREHIESRTQAPTAVAPLTPVSEVRVETKVEVEVVAAPEPITEPEPIIEPEPLVELETEPNEGRWDRLVADALTRAEASSSAHADRRRDRRRSRGRSRSRAVGDHRAKLRRGASRAGGYAARSHPITTPRHPRPSRPSRPPRPRPQPRSTAEVEVAPPAAVGSSTPRIVHEPTWSETENQWRRLVAEAAAGRAARSPEADAGANTIVSDPTPAQTTGRWRRLVAEAGIRDDESADAEDEVEEPVDVSVEPAAMREVVDLTTQPSAPVTAGGAPTVSREIERLPRVGSDLRVMIDALRGKPE